MNPISNALTGIATTAQSKVAKQVTTNDVNALKDSIRRDYFEKMRLEELLFDEKKSASITVSVQDQLKHLSNLLSKKKNELNEMIQSIKDNEGLNVLA